MRHDYFTTLELLQIKDKFDPVINDKRATFKRYVENMSINESLAFIRNLQESIAQHNKLISLNLQMDIIRLTHMIEKIISPRMYVWYRKHIKTKYPQITDKMACRLANEKVTKCFAKYRY